MVTTGITTLFTLIGQLGQSGDTGITTLFTLIGQLGQSGDHRYNYIVYTDRTIRTEW